jgi:hypothetical protein
MQLNKRPDDATVALYVIHVHGPSAEQAASVLDLVRARGNPPISMGRAAVVHATVTHGSDAGGGDFFVRAVCHEQASLL